MTQRRIYLDHNATTPLHPQVKERLVQALELFGNPSSMHEFGREARQQIEQQREQIAGFINARADELIFVGSGSEANNTVLNLNVCSSPHCWSNRQGRSEIITTRIEHPCVLETSRCLQDRGITVHYLDVDHDGKVSLAQLDALLSDRTAIVSVMMANNEIGTIQDIQSLCERTHAAGAYFHTDAVQAVGKIPVDTQALDVDFLSFSAHKIYGPKGIGGLYVKKGVPFCSFIRGGHQERGRRAGTENTLGIIGMGQAIEMRRREMPGEERRLQELKTALMQGLATIPDIRFNGHPSDCLPGTLNVSVQGCEGEALLLYLDLAGIAVSTGSACSSGSLDPSHVLLAVGASAELAHGSIRVSMGRDNTPEDIEYFIRTFREVVQRVRSMSTAYRAGSPPAADSGRTKKEALT